MKIMVTGGAGFLGSWLVKELLAQKHAVVAYDNLVGGSWENLPPLTTSLELEQRQGDILDLDNLTDALHGCQAVYHCAALPHEGLSVFSPALITENIYCGSVKVMTGAIRVGVKRLINLSSMARYGNCPKPYEEGYFPQPVDPYGMAKHQAEQQLSLLGSIHGVTVVHAVPHNIYGPRQRYWDPFRNVAAIMLNRLAQNQAPVIYGDGEQRRCFSYIGDVLPTLLRLLEVGNHDEVFNIGPDEGAVSINELTQLLLEITGKQHLQPQYLPARPCEVKEALCSSRKIRRRFGFCQWTSLCDGMTELWDWIQERGPRPFVYHLPLEINNSLIPKTWSERLF